MNQKWTFFIVLPLLFFSIEKTFSQCDSSQILNLGGCETKTLQSSNSTAVLYEWDLDNNGAIDTTLFTSNLVFDFGSDTLRTVRLITEYFSGCRDTTTATINVQKVSASFDVDTILLSGGCETQVIVDAHDQNHTHSWGWGTPLFNAAPISSNPVDTLVVSQFDYPAGIGQRYVQHNVTALGCNAVAYDTVAIANDFRATHSVVAPCSKEATLTFSHNALDAVDYVVTDWGDGTTTVDSSNFFTRSHTYVVDSTYDVESTVFLEKGCTRTFSSTVTTNGSLFLYTLDTNCVDSIVLLTWNVPVLFFFYVEINGVAEPSFASTAIFNPEDTVFFWGLTSVGDCYEEVASRVNIDCSVTTMDIENVVFAGKALSGENMLSWHNPDRDHLILQKSKDGIFFEDVFASSEIRKKYIDENPYFHTYYRLENEGEYSRTIVLEQKLKMDFSVYPNPVNAGGELLFSQVENGTEVYFYNSLGTIVFQGVVQNKKITLPEIASGIYYIAAPDLGVVEKITVKN